VGLAIRYLPTTYGLFVSIGEAQQARGWIVGQGGVLQRARSYVPILVATIIASLRLSDNLGMALAARGLGYPARRTVLYDLAFTAVDWFGGGRSRDPVCRAAGRGAMGLGFGGQTW